MRGYPLAATIKKRREASHKGSFVHRAISDQSEIAGPQSSRPLRPVIAKNVAIPDSRAVAVNALQPELLDRLFLLARLDRAEQTGFHPPFDIRSRHDVKRSRHLCRKLEFVGVGVLH